MSIVEVRDANGEWYPVGWLDATQVAVTVPAYEPSTLTTTVLAVPEFTSRHVMVADVAELSN